MIVPFKPQDLLYRKTSSYYWPNFNANATSLANSADNIGGWNPKTGVDNGPIGFGSDVKLNASQVSILFFPVCGTTI